MSQARRDAMYRARWATPLGEAPTAQEIIQQDRQIWSLSGPPTGPRPRGTLLPEQIRALRAWRPQRGTGELRWMAEQLGISLTSLYNIRARWTYKKIPGPVGQFAPDPELDPPPRRPPGPTGRLTDEQVRMVRGVRTKQGEGTLKRLAAELGVSVPLLYDIRAGRAYADVPPDIPLEHPTIKAYREWKP